MILDILLTTFLVALNGFFVAAEFALVKIRTSQIETDALKNNKYAKLSMNIVNNLESYLSGCQLGITIASLALGAIGEPLVERMIHSLLNFIGFHISHNILEIISYVTALIILTTLHVVFGEQAPKIMALQSAKKTTYAISYPLYFFYMIFRPAVWLLNWLSNSTLKLLGFNSGSHQDTHSLEELRILIDQGKDSGVLIHNEHEFIQNVFDFKHTTAHQVMIPRQKINVIDIDCDIDQTIGNIINEGYSRIPVFKGSMDNIIGILCTKDLIKLFNQKVDGQKVNIQDAIKPAYFVHENKKISDLLKELQSKKSHMAIVMDEYSSVIGLLTIEDILEEIVGEIQDEHDEDVPVVKLIGDEFIVSAFASINDVNELLPVKLPKGTYETVNGYITMILDKIPDLNDTIQTSDYNITVLKKNNHIVQTLKLKRI